MKKPVLTLLLTAAAGPGWPASAAAPATDPLVACSAIADTNSRLACFDREIAPLAAGRTQKAAPPTATAAPPPAPVAIRSEPKVAAHSAESAASFGAENLSTPLSAIKSQVLHARIAELNSAGSGRFLVTLDNGQIWRHEDSYQGAYLKQGEAVTIAKGTLGAYRLTRDAGQAKNWIRVARVR